MPIEAARSNESSFADLAMVKLARVPQLFVFDGVINPASGLDSAYNPGLLRTLSRLPDVERSKAPSSRHGPLTSNGDYVMGAAPSPTAEASVGGLDSPRTPSRSSRDEWSSPKGGRSRDRCGPVRKALGDQLGEEMVGRVTNSKNSSASSNRTSRSRFM